MADFGILFVFLFFFFLFSLFVCLSDCQFTSLSFVCLIVSRHVYLSVFLSVCLFVFLFLSTNLRLYMCFNSSDFFPFEYFNFFHPSDYLGKIKEHNNETKTLKTKDFNNEMEMLRQNYSHYMKLTEQLQTQIRELKYNMTYIVEKAVDQLVNEKLSQMKLTPDNSEDKTGKKLFIINNDN